MITEQDIKTVEKIKAILEPMTEKGETGVNWQYVEMQDTLDKLVNNLRIAHVSYCAAPEEDKKQNYYTAECSKCGWWGSSKLMNGGGQIADTGDYFDGTCPVCDNDEIEEKGL
jgi:hypothetical protein